MLVSFKPAALCTKADFTFQHWGMQPWECSLCSCLAEGVGAKHGVQTSVFLMLSLFARPDIADISVLKLLMS